MTKENGDDVGFGMLIGAAILMVLIAIFYPAIREPIWTDGYCAALGGERITRYTCNVEGRVVEV